MRLSHFSDFAAQPTGRRVFFSEYSTGSNYSLLSQALTFPSGIFDTGVMVVDLVVEPYIVFDYYDLTSGGPPKPRVTARVSFFTRAVTRGLTLRIICMLDHQNKKDTPTRYLGYLTV